MYKIPTQNNIPYVKCATWPQKKELKNFNWQIGNNVVYVFSVYVLMVFIYLILYKFYLHF